MLNKFSSEISLQTTHENYDTTSIFKISFELRKYNSTLF